MIEVWNSVGHDFNGNRDLLLHLFGRMARPLSNDLNVVVGNVRIGLHGKVMKGYGSPNEKQNGRNDDDESIVQGGIDQLVNHERFVTGAWSCRLRSLASFTMARNRRASSPIQCSWRRWIAS